MVKSGFVVFLLTLGLFFYSLTFSSATPFIAGFVNDSFDGAIANGRIITLWNPSVGLSDNLTDTIGPFGNSGADNFYMIDCSLLNTPCNLGDIVSIKVFADGLERASKVVNVSISGAGFEIAPNLAVNALPNVTLVSPVDYANVSQLLFNCSAFDYDGNLASISLYSNFSGTFILNETKNITGQFNSTTFTKNPLDGRYNWACAALDDLGGTHISSNRTVLFDTQPPIIESLTANETRVCGINNSVRITCNTSDGLSGIYNVIIQATSNISSTNHSTLFSGLNTYFADITLDQLGAWNFTCFSNDSASNLNSSNYSFGGVFENIANLLIDYSSMIFSKQNPVESETITMNVSILNDGCVDTNDLLVGFYKGDPSSGGLQLGTNLTLNLSKGNSSNLNISFQTDIGVNNIYSLVDVDNQFNESSEIDNKVNKSINVVSWHLFYGNITADRVLSTLGMYNLSLWLNDSNSSGNVYVSDTESQIHWTSLLAFGRNTTNGVSSDDFSEIDSILDSANYPDSISNTYTSNGVNPRNISNFTVSNLVIENVPIVNTTSPHTFITGMLWDSFDDSNGQYDSLDKEDIVFITNIHRNTMGSRGIYDYEISVPAKLREYQTTDTEEVYIYFDLN